MTSHEQTLRMAGGLRMAGQIGPEASASGPAAPSGALVARRGPAEIWLPGAGTPPVVTSAAAGWAFGAWTAIGTPVNDFFVSAWMDVWENAPFAITASVTEYAYGAARTPIDAYRNCSIGNDPTADGVMLTNFHSVGHFPRVPAGETAYARLATQETTAQSHRVALIGFDGSLPTFEDLTSPVAGNGRYLPSNLGGTGLTVAVGGSWFYGPSTTVLASAPNDMLVTHIAVYAAIGPFSSIAGLAQIGFGPAGSETWCATHAIGRNLTTPVIWPPVLIKAGERLAIRAARSASATSWSFFIKVYDL